MTVHRLRFADTVADPRNEAEAYQQMSQAHGCTGACAEGIAACNCRYAERRCAIDADDDGDSTAAFVERWRARLGLLGLVAVVGLFLYALARHAA